MYVPSYQWNKFHNSYSNQWNLIRVCVCIWCTRWNRFGRTITNQLSMLSSRQNWKRPLVLNNEIVKKKIKGILVISGCGNSGLDNKESMQIRNKDFIFHKSIGAIRSGLLHKFFQNDRQKIKETSHLVLGSYDIQKNKKKRFVTDAKARCRGVWLLKNTVCNLNLMNQIIAGLSSSNYFILFGFPNLRSNYQF